MVGVVQKVALDAPHLVVHLIPLGAGVDVNLQIFQFQLTVAGFDGSARSGNKPVGTLLVQNLFAIGGNRKGIDAADEGLGLAGGEIELAYRDGSWFVEARNV